MDLSDIYPSFDVDMDGMIELIRNNGYRKVLVQVPEGLKRGAPHMVEKLEEATNASMILDGDPCFGACDNSSVKAKALGMDALIHLGHSDIPSMERDPSMPIHFFPVGMKVNRKILNEGIRELLTSVREDRIGLATTVQHIHLLDEIKVMLKVAGKMVRIGPPGKREFFPGQVIGCSFHCARSIASEVEAFLYIGTGRFHPMGLFFAIRKKVYCLDPMTGRISIFEAREMDRFIRVRHSQITRAQDLIDKGERVGIILCEKPGQKRSDLAGSLSEELNSRGIKNEMIVMDHISPMKIKTLGSSVVVSTACPRIAIDDHRSYSEEGIVILTPVELRIALGKMGIEDYLLDEEW